MLTEAVEKLAVTGKYLAIIAGDTNTAISKVSMQLADLAPLYDNTCSVALNEPNTASLKKLVCVSVS